jgi:hypothetical protein
MTLSLGTKMIRSDDGMKGVVELVESPGGTVAPRVVYYDRGERRVAPKSEKWEPERAPSGALTEIEQRMVAAAADQMLKSLDKHEPFHWWEQTPGLAHDPELVEVIVEYLKRRV